jgi:ATP-dependent RNA helicase DDX10/DBP4
MYIHRVGRTARYTAGGRGLLMLLPSEEKAVLDELSHAGIPIKRVSMNPNKTVSVSNRAAALLVSNPECRSLAKKAFTSYLKSYILLPRNKVCSLPVSRLGTHPVSGLRSEGY